MSTFPAQVTSPLLDLGLDGDIRRAELLLKEARWWGLEPGEPGYGVPLHEYLGFTWAAWREYAISDRRTR